MNIRLAQITLGLSFVLHLKLTLIGAIILREDYAMKAKKLAQIAAEHDADVAWRAAETRYNTIHEQDGDIGARINELYAPMRLEIMRRDRPWCEAGLLYAGALKLACDIAEGVTQPVSLDQQADEYEDAIRAQDIWDGLK